MKRRTVLVNEPDRSVRLPHEVVLSEVRMLNPRYDDWIDLYWALYEVWAKPPTIGSHGWPEHSLIATAFDRMIQLAGQDWLKWTVLRLAVYKELKARNLIDDEGRICP
jgi:hypothetical protein